MASGAGQWRTDCVGRLVDVGLQHGSKPIPAEEHWPNAGVHVMNDVGPVLTALADSTRRAILQGLRTRPRPVGEIARDFRVSRPAVSQHLKVLHEAGLLRCYRTGRQNFYALDLKGLTLLRNYVESFWDDVLGAFQAAAIEQALRTNQRDRSK